MRYFNLIGTQAITEAEDEALIASVLGSGVYVEVSKEDAIIIKDKAEQSLKNLIAEADKKKAIKELAVKKLRLLGLSEEEVLSLI